MKKEKQAILKDGFNIDDFQIGYLTKEQYENRFDIEHEKVTINTFVNTKEGMVKYED